MGSGEVVGGIVKGHEGHNVGKRSSGIKQFEHYNYTLPWDSPVYGIEVLYGP